MVNGFVLSEDGRLLASRWVVAQVNRRWITLMPVNGLFCQLMAHDRLFGPLVGRRRILPGRQYSTTQPPVLFLLLF